MKLRTLLIALFVVFCSSAVLAVTPFVERDLPPAPDNSGVWKVISFSAGDIDGDQKTESMMVWRNDDTAENQVWTYHWYAGQFRVLIPSFSFSNLGGMGFIYLEDTDSDGALELITVHDRGDLGSPFKIFEWTGTSWLEDWSTEFSTVRRQHTVAVEDLDGDGLNEIAVAIDWYSREMVVIDYDDVSGSYEVNFHIGANDYRSAAAGDVDGDGDMDLVAGCGNWSYYDSRVYEWDGTQYVETWNSPTYGNVTTGLVDHNGDGVLDLAIANWASSHVSGQNGLHLYQWTGSTFEFQYTLAADIPLLVPTAMDFDNDGVMDLGALTMEFDEPGTHFGDGIRFFKFDGTQMQDYFTFPDKIATQSGAIMAEDLDNDGLNEVVCSLLLDTETDRGVRLQHVASSPIISSITDIPLDNGRQLRVNWIRASADDPEANDFVTDYSIWRGVKDGLKTADSALMTTTSGNVYELVATTPAMQWDKYSQVVSTLADSAEIADPLWDFIVTAHMSDGRSYTTSPVQCGYSLDIQAPSVPAELFAHMAGADMQLSWPAVEDDDLNFYTVYRQEFTSSSPVELCRTSFTSYLDSEIGEGAFGAIYFVSATDRVGNESAMRQGPSSTGVEDFPQAGKALSLSAYPNPFNPSTTLEFNMPSSGPATLEIINVAGKRICTIWSGLTKEGLNSFTWNGTDKTGRQVGSGVYFARLQANHEIQTKVLSLIK